MWCPVWLQDTARKMALITHGLLAFTSKSMSQNKPLFFMIHPVYGTENERIQ
jgi:hypothetical protein